jgi:hypothetical protein
VAEIRSPQLLFSAGGFCAPTPALEPGRGYNLGPVRVHCDGTRTAPLRDSLPRFTARRGGILMTDFSDPQVPPAVVPPGARAH